MISAPMCADSGLKVSTIESLPRNFYNRTSSMMLDVSG